MATWRDGVQPEWTARWGLPNDSRLRVGLTKRSGVSIRFLVQIEYNDADTLLPVARFDHDSLGPPYRNVELVGLGLDLYAPDGEQVEKVDRWAPQASNAAMGDAETYLRGNVERLIRRFEAWL